MSTSRLEQPRKTAKLPPLPRGGGIGEFARGAGLAGHAGAEHKVSAPVVIRLEG
jgi:hypothetical protein